MALATAGGVLVSTTIPVPVNEACGMTVLVATMTVVLGVDELDEDDEEDEIEETLVEGVSEVLACDAEEEDGACDELATDVVMLELSGR